MLIESVAKGTYRSLPVTIMKKTYQPPLDDNPVLYDTLFVLEKENMVTVFEKEVWRYTDGTIYHIWEDTVGEVILKYPLYEGKTWVYWVKSPGDLKIIVNVLSKEKVHTPLGTFDECYKISYWWELNPNNPHYEWFAPNVGMVKYFDPPVDTKTLIDYRVK